MVGVEGEVFAAFEVVAERLEGVDDCKQFQLMDGVILLCWRELAALIAHGVFFLLQDCT